MYAFNREAVPRRVAPVMSLGQSRGLDRTRRSRSHEVAAAGRPKRFQRLPAEPMRGMRGPAAPGQPGARLPPARQTQKLSPLWRPAQLGLVRELQRLIVFGGKYADELGTRADAQLRENLP